MITSKCILFHKSYINSISYKYYSKLQVLKDSHCITFNKIGDPSKVLKYSKFDQNQINSAFTDDGELKDGNVMIKNIAASINPADINYIQVYLFKNIFIF